MPGRLGSDEDPPPVYVLPWAFLGVYMEREPVSPFLSEGH